MLSKRDAAIIGAYTGVTCGPFKDIHDYVETLPGFKGIGPIGMIGMGELIRKACKQDFLEVCYKEQEGYY